MRRYTHLARRGRNMIDTYFIALGPSAVVIPWLIACLVVFCSLDTSK